MKEPFIAMRNVSAGYDGTAAIRNADLELREGDFMAVVGPNGGGKTTLFRTILGLIEPYEGEVTVMGTAPSKGCVNIGYVPQFGSFDRKYPVLAEEVVSMGLRPRQGLNPFVKSDGESVREAMRYAGADAFAGKRIGELSGGQLQRVLLARALASEPRMLLLDEPTAALDAEMRSGVYDMLGKASGDGMTVMMITHDLEGIGNLANRVVRVDGTLAEIGETHRGPCAGRADLGDVLGYLEIPLIQNMFAATVLACVLCGVMGAYVVVNRMVAVTGGIAHTAFGGVGLAYYLMSVCSVTWMTPMAGALIFSVASATIMVLCRRIGELRDDTVIGALWAAGMALGVVFMCYMDRSAIVPSSYESILFGNMLLVDSSKLRTMACATATIVAAVAFLYRDLRIMTFDRAHAKISGINVTALDLALHILIAVTCVMVSNVVGIVMIMALMTIPAAMGNLFSGNLGGTMIVGTLFAAALSVLGLFLSLSTDAPPGATVVLIVSAAFAAASILRRALPGPRRAGRWMRAVFIDSQDRGY